jgi:pimeloyl-ACP methyl ester carboxylesterase
MFPTTCASSSHKISCPHAGGKHDIHVLKWSARTECGMPPVVCVHGLTRRGEDFRRLAETLSQTQNRDVYSFTMAGRGESDLLPPELYTYDQYVADCRYLLQRFELREIDWVGTSMGGIIGMLIASSDASLIRRLVLNDVGPFISVEGLKILAQHVTGYKGEHFKNKDDAVSYCAFACSSYGISGTVFWEELLDNTIVYDSSGAFRLHYDPHIVDMLRNPNAIVAPMNLWPQYDKIIAPILVLHGADSYILSNETASEMTRHGPQPRVVSFSGCGHAPALAFDEQIGTILGFFMH